jgi:hypothetical protein
MILVMNIIAIYDDSDGHRVKRKGKFSRHSNST